MRSMADLCKQLGVARHFRLLGEELGAFKVAKYGEYGNRLKTIEEHVR